MRRRYHPKDYIGRKFGFLTLMSVIGCKDKGKTMFPFKCDCGNIKLLHLCHVVTGHDISCGCELGKQHLSTQRIKHGLSGHPLYKTWNNITQRAGKHRNYLNIKVCNEWKLNFVNFYNWAINNGYKKGLTIDRIDFKGDYAPENCRWITQKEQMKNQSRNHYVTINGETKVFYDWCSEFGISPGTVYKRLAQGFSYIEALTTPVNKKFSNKGRLGQRTSRKLSTTAR